MKKHVADKELESILLFHGFIEISSKEEIVKGKKRFKTNKSSRKLIYFDYKNIKVYYSSICFEIYTSFSEEELRLLLLYFKISSNDYKELSSIRGLRINEVKEGMARIEDEREQLIKHNLKKARVNKLTRIIDLYEGISIRGL